MASESDRLIAQISALSEAEAFVREWFAVLAGYAVYDALPVWMIKAYNELADIVNLDVSEVMASVRTTARPSLPQPVLVPRVVLAAAPNQDAILLPDERLLGNSDVLARNLIRPAVTAVEGNCNTNGELGNPVTGMQLIYRGMGGVIGLGLAAITVPEIRRSIEAWTGVTKERVLSREYQERVKEHLDMMTRVQTWVDACVRASGGVKDAPTLKACSESIPSIMRTPTARPRGASGSSGAWLVNVGVATVVVVSAAVGGAYLWRRHKLSAKASEYALRKEAYEQQAAVEEVKRRGKHVKRGAAARAAAKGRGI